MANIFCEDNFQSEVLESPVPVLVDFWASWCAPCKMLAPIIEEIDEELSEDVIVGKVNVDEEEQLAIKYGIMSIPTVIAFKDGKEIGRTIGLTSKDEILSLLK